MYVVPIICYLACVFQLSKTFVSKVQILGYHFIWSGHFEKMAMKEMYTSEAKGGLGLIHLLSKCKSLFVSNIIKQFMKLNGGPLARIHENWFGLNLLPLRDPLKNCPHRLTVPSYFRQIFQEIKVMMDQNVISKNNYSAKTIYNHLAKKVSKIPKMIAGNSHINFDIIFQNIQNKYILPTAKETIFKMAHNILSTKP